MPKIKVNKQHYFNNSKCFIFATYLDVNNTDKINCALRFLDEVLCKLHKIMQIVSKAAAYRILSQEIGKIIKFVKSLRIISKNVVQVTYFTVYGTCSTFISLRKFKQNFVNLRKQNSQKLQVVQSSNTSFQVFNPEQKTQYTVIPYLTGIDCNCEDYGNQIIKFGRGCCKHGYATLRTLGFQSLQEYLKKNTTAA